MSKHLTITLLRIPKVCRNGISLKYKVRQLSINHVFLTTFYWFSLPELLEKQYELVNEK